MRAAAAGALCALLLSACAPQPPRALQPDELADATTRAVYDGDVARTGAYFNPHLRATVTPRSVAAVSRLMRRFGSYRELTTVAQVVTQRRYFYEAEFDRGSMFVQLRLDKDGRTIAAYRVTPNLTH